MRAALPRDPGEHRQGRADGAGLPGDLAQQQVPAIVDPDGPGGEPISVFESGAILQYLGRKTGCLYPSDERARVAVDEWLFWQVGGLGPMLGQAHHFRIYAKEKVPYAIGRYTEEAKRLYGVLDHRLQDREYLAGEYSIADVAALPWAKFYEKQGIDLASLAAGQSLARRIARASRGPNEGSRRSDPAAERSPGIRVVRNARRRPRRRRHP